MATTVERPPTEPAGFQWTWPGVVLISLALAVLGASLGYWSGNRKAEEPTGGPVAVGFLQDMIDHHDQAVEMAQYALAGSETPVVRSFAEETMMRQRWEVGVMDAWLGQYRARRGELDREAMGWMGMPTPLAEMPGLQTPDEIDALRAAGADTVDRLFLTMMREHHEGGIHMAEYAARVAEDESVRAFAATMARNQALEVQEYDAVISGLPAS